MLYQELVRARSRVFLSHGYMSLFVALVLRMPFDRSYRAIKMFLEDVRIPQRVLRRFLDNTCIA